MRLGLAIRSLRRRRGWTQEQLARQARVSRSSVSLIERGGADRLTMRGIANLLAPLAARIRVQVLWQGEELDRLLDSRHASLVERMATVLAAAAWVVIPEATFRIGTERGSVDILAWHPATGSLLVVEVKSVVPDVQATLAGVDRKARIAPELARDRGWAVTSVSRLLVLPDDRTARRRIERYATTFVGALPSRTAEVKRWLRSPSGAMAGILFLTDANQVDARHRVSRART